MSAADPILAEFDAPEQAGADLSDPLSRADLPLTDVGAALRLQALYGTDLVMVRGRGFAVWDGKRFDPDRGEALAMRAAHGLREAVLKEADAVRRSAPTARELEAAETYLAGGPREADGTLLKKTPGEIVRDKRQRKAAALFKFANQCHSAAKIAAALKHVAVLEGVMREPEEMDAEALKFNCANGTLDLARLPEGGEVLEPEELAPALLPFERADFATRIARARFEPLARAPNFQKLLDLVQPMPEMQSFLQRVLGSTLSGAIGAQTAYLFQGEGANAKSTILNIAAHVLGSYSASVPVQAFLRETNSSGSAATPEFARLPGVRMVRASEPPSNATLDEAKIKRWTGGEEQPARNLRESFFDFTPRFKVFLTFNRTPKVAVDDHGTWRRLKLVPFRHIIADERQRPFDLVMAELRLEAAGILNWMIDGFRAWRAEGLNPPADVIEATAELRSDMDTLGQFLGETTIADEAGEIVFSDLKRIADKWREAQGERPWSANWMGRALSERGFRALKVGRGKQSIRRGLRWPRGGTEESVGEPLLSWLRELGIDWFEGGGSAS